MVRQPGTASGSGGARKAKGMPPKYTKRPWLPAEDQLLYDAVMSLGAPEFAVKGCEKSGVRWTDIAKLVPDRAAKQCRERWRNHLDPGVSREAWTEEENAILLARYEQFGSMWAEIASGLPGRADNGCKNQWNKLMGWGSSASRPRKAELMMMQGEQLPKKSRRQVPPGSMLGRPASRGQGGAAAGIGTSAADAVRPLPHSPAGSFSSRRGIPVVLTRVGTCCRCCVVVGWWALGGSRAAGTTREEHVAAATTREDVHQFKIHCASAGRGCRGCCGCAG